TTPAALACFRQAYNVTSVIPVSSDNSLTGLLLGGIICLTTFSLRSIEYLLTFCSHPPAVYHFHLLNSHDNYPDTAGYCTLLGECFENVGDIELNEVSSCPAQ